ncbi:type II toxin-antitoxin system RelE/ParE family toxin [Sphingobium sp. Z007]|uniref:type II toxin-antitoxin system RelE/ParE family toxin n=1 Tax=Sphingobium sp. Z007 TaxID=627495 RepID=UPI000B49EAF5|nr:type II toxin-antitoxin system RelE/ParE family toxin [Sphingobium sp. Z007]
MIVEFAKAAEDDLEAIGDYIARDNPIRAISFIRELRTACLDLGTMPERFPTLAAFERQGIRRRLHGNYLIFYRVDGAQVTIIHILHGASDYASLIFRN